MLNPVLSAEQAASYTIENVLGGTDTWQPKLYTDQAAAPVIAGDERVISWTNNDYVLCWAVFRNNQFVKFVTTNSYTIPEETTSGSTYTVKAANEMGGLSQSSNPHEYVKTGIFTQPENTALIDRKFYSAEGKQIINLTGYSGFIIVRSVYADGSVITDKILKATPKR